MTNDVDTDSAFEAVNLCCAIFNSAFKAIPDSAKFVVAFGCCCHSISSGGEIFDMKEHVYFTPPNRWPLPATVACLL